MSLSGEEKKEPEVPLVEKDPAKENVELQLPAGAKGLQVDGPPGDRLEHQEPNNGSQEGQSVQPEQHIRHLKNKQTVALGNVTKKKNELVELMINCENLNYVKSNFDEYVQRYFRYKQAHELHCDALANIEADTELEETRFSNRQSSILEFQKEVTNWIKTVEGQLTSELGEAADLARSVKAKHGSLTSKSSQNSARSARLLEKAKIAELRIEREMLHKRHQLLLEEKSLDLDMKLAKAQAREQVLAAAIDEDEADKGDGMNSYYEKNMKMAKSAVTFQKYADQSYTATLPQSNLGETAEPRQTKTQPQVTVRKAMEPRPTETQPAVNSTLNVNAAEFVARTADSADQLLSIMSLPTPEVPKFKGDIINYRTFIIAFDARIGSRLNSFEDKLYYLDQCLLGDAKTLISGCLDLDDAMQGYNDARALLDKEYGDPFKIGMVYLNKIQQWSVIKPDDCVGLKQFSIFLCKCKTSIVIPI